METLQEDNVQVEQVRLVVPESDNYNDRALTFRTWILGLFFCVMLSIVNMLFSLRKQQLTVQAYCAQVLALPLGRLMAAYLPETVRVWRWQVELNPGPFNIKEHVLITVFANAGATSVSAMHTITVLKAFYRRNPGYFVALFLTVTTQVMGFGFIGPFREFLVSRSTMWWPSNLVQVSLYRAMHEEGTQIRFFLIVMGCSFLYYLVPGYLFTVLSSISWICYIWPHSILAHQLGSGTKGLGLGTLGFDWSTIAGFLSSPLATPLFAIVNLMAGFVLILYVLVPLAYWKANLFNSRRFPIFSKNLFNEDGLKYNVTRVLTDSLQLDVHAYQEYSNVYLSIIFVFTYAAGFASITAALVHVALFHGKEVLRAWRGVKESKDIHTRLMSRYKQVPQWWFWSILFTCLGVSLLICELNPVLQFPWWCLILATLMGIVLTFPVAVIYATTNQLLSIASTFAEATIGYMYPGRPMTVMLFRGYGTSTMVQAVHMLGELKLGHYMKIPPRQMFGIQALGTTIAAACYLSVGWYLFETIPNICDPELLPPNSPWTCPHDTIFFDGSVIWGLIGPRRIFGPGATYSTVNFAFLLGALAPIPVWALSKVFPTVTWLKYVNLPVILSAGGRMPYATAVNFWSWFLVGVVFNYFVFKYRKNWWKQHTYVLSGAMDAGVAFMGVLIYFAFDFTNTEVKWWGNRLDEQCPLASCPTAPGIKVKGCPVL